MHPQGYLDGCAFPFNRRNSHDCAPVVPALAGGVGSGAPATWRNIAVIHRRSLPIPRPPQVPRHLSPTLARLANEHP